MAYRWPAGTTFKRMALAVEDRSCPVCHRSMPVCDYRYHALWTFEGPTQVVYDYCHLLDPRLDGRGISRFQVDLYRDFIRVGLHMRQHW